MTASGIASIRERSARLLRVISILATVLWALLLLERFGNLGWRLIQRDPTASTQAVIGALVAATPDVCYLLALHGIRQALVEFARGELYAPTITRMLVRVGNLLAAGACLGVFVVPALERALGAGPGYWIAFDVSALVLGALGLFLTLIARVFGRAAVLEAELDEIF